MKSIDIFVKPIPGQFWLDVRSCKLHEIKSIKDNELVYTTEYAGSEAKEVGIRLPMQLVLLWNVAEIKREEFSKAPKTGQAWVTSPSGEVFFIHPDQTGLTDTVKVLSDGYHIRGSYTLIHDV